MIELDFEVDQYIKDSYIYVDNFMDIFILSKTELDNDEQLRICFTGILEPITIALNKDQCDDINAMTFYTMLRNIPTGAITMKSVLVEEI